MSLLSFMKKQDDAGKLERCDFSNEQCDGNIRVRTKFE
jgi:hypothetical protein